MEGIPKGRVRGPVVFLVLVLFLVLENKPRTRKRKISATLRDYLTRRDSNVRNVLRHHRLG